MGSPAHLALAAAIVHTSVDSFVAVAAAAGIDDRQRPLHPSR